jgi:hypothetical protein
VEVFNVFSHSLQRRALFTVTLVITGCIDQDPDKAGSADELTNRASQALTEFDDTGGEPSSGDFPFEITYQDSDFLDPGSVVQDDVVTQVMDEIVVTATRLPTDPEIESLNLNGPMTDLAYELRDRYPTIRFTSGRRSIASQARAMAANVVQQRQWIAQTYRSSPLRDALQQWVDSHPGSTAAQIEAGLTAIFAAASPADVASFSRHLSGDAFDVQPINGALGNAIHNDLSNLPGRFLDHEGNLRRWHYER